MFNNKSHTNPKNRLQEFCQRQSIGLPLYDSYRVTATGEYTCICTMVFQQKTFQGRGESVKVKDAEKKAAQDVLNILDKYDLSRVKVVTREDLHPDEYIIVYLDIENINVNELKELFKYHKYNADQIEFKGMLSTNHHHSATQFEQLQEFQEIAFTKCIVPSTRSDGADIGMVMQAMNDICVERCCEAPPSEVIFVSRDKFSCVFVDLVNNNFCVPEQLKAFHCAGVPELKQLLGGQ